MTTAPDEAFGLLGNETRVEILRVIAQETASKPNRETVAFSEIYDGLDIRDSGQFSYHLDKLLDHFVEQLDSGYRLSYAGWQVVWAIRAGTFHEAAATEFDAPGTCYACGEAALRARTRNAWLGISCESCDTLLTSNPLPPAVLETRSLEEITHVYDAVVRNRVALVSERVCLQCCGPMEATITDDTLEEWSVDAIPQFTCSYCAYWYHPHFGLLLLDHSTVEAFFSDYGVELADRPFWDIPFCVDPSLVTVRSRDPWRIDVEVTEDGRELRAVFDETAAIHEVTINS